MTRPYSWYPLASSDPVPGDPTVVREGGAHYTATATAIANAATTLDNILTTQDTVSDAVDAVRERMRAVAERIRTAHSRYDAAGSALTEYATHLDTAQGESLDALRAAQAAQRSLDIADDAVRRWTRLIDDAEDAGEDASTARRALDAARNERTDAEHAIAAARLRLDDAVALRDRAAAQATTAFGSATDDDLDDGWWEDWGADVAQVVSTWAGNISTVLGVASLFLGWVPVIGQALAIGAFVTGAAALAADVLLAINRGDDGDWFNVGMGLLGLVTFGASGRLASAVKAFRVEALTAAGHAHRAGVRPLLALRGARPATSVIASPRGRALTALHPPPSWAARVQAAWSEVMALHGHQRVLALAGHGDLVKTSNALRSQLAEPYPNRVGVRLHLAIPVIKGAGLQGGALALYAGDATLAYTAVSKSAIESIVAPGSASDRLSLTPSAGTA